MRRRTTGLVLAVLFVSLLVFCTVVFWWHRNDVVQVGNDDWFDIEPPVTSARTDGRGDDAPGVASRPASGIPPGLAGEFGLAVLRSPSSPIEVGTWREWSFQYTVGGRSLLAGESLAIEFPYYYMYPSWSPPQISDPEGPGYVSVHSSSPGAGFVVTTSAPMDLKPRISVRFAAPGIPPGGTLDLRYGDRSRGGPGARPQGFACPREGSGCKPFRLVLRGVEREEISDHEFPVEFRPGPVERLVAIAPASLPRQERFDFLVRAEDQFGNTNPFYRGTVQLEETELLEYEISAHRFSASDQGVYRFRGLRIDGTGTTRLRLRDLRNGLEAHSNPIVPVAEGHLRVFFGDLHVHSGVSDDSRGTLDELFSFAYDVMGLDFAGSSNHDMDLLAHGGWEEVLASTREHDIPGSFAAFLGYEWTSPAAHGHRNVVFPGFEGQVFSATDPFSDTPEELWRLLEPYQALTVPHLPMPRGLGFHHQADWQPKNEEMQRLVEVYSQWTPRSVEMDGVDIETSPDGVQDAWRRGHRLGLVGGSDNHAGHPGETGGLTAILAPCLDREALWEGLLHRRCYATTGARIWLDFRIGSHVMGEEVALAEPESLRVVVHGTGMLERVELIRLQGKMFEVFHTEYPGSEDVQFELPDIPVQETSMYYIRVFQEDGHRAWSSPIWLSGRQESAGGPKGRDFQSGVGW